MQGEEACKGLNGAVGTSFLLWAGGRARGQEGHPRREPLLLALSHCVALEQPGFKTVPGKRRGPRRPQTAGRASCVPDSPGLGFILSVHKRRLGPCWKALTLAFAVRKPGLREGEGPSRAPQLLPSARRA